MHGCNGKMGRMITEIVKNDENAVISAGVDAYVGVPNDYPVCETLEKCDADADVVVDFSNAGAVDGLLGVKMTIYADSCENESDYKERWAIAGESSRAISILVNIFMQLMSRPTSVM